jgi:SAM-dependent methyltransferase
MSATIDTDILSRIASHHRSLDLKNWVKGLPYERCAELSWVIAHLRTRFRDHLDYLDIGTGESPLPSYLYAATCWNITCLDKFDWVRKQLKFSRAVSGGQESGERFRVVQADLLQAGLPEKSFDIITCISVIEHFEGNSDTSAIQACARLLRRGGKLILTTLVNENHYREFFLNESVYGDRFEGRPVFYQRHYDNSSLQKRLLEPSGLMEKRRVYFGDYGFQCFEKVLQQPKLLRVLYAWNTPWLAKRYLTYRSYPVSRPDMRMNTASGLILVLEKT